MAWNPDLYQSSHSFVWEYGRGLLELLAPAAGERILDVGCGTGQLTDEIARTGAGVVGIDQSEAMITQARKNYPSIEFHVREVCELPFHEEFDAVFSNAVLHWVTRAEEAAAAMARALKPGGRMVLEFGGHGNVAMILEALRQALGRDVNPWYYPGIAEYAGLLERCGLETTFATLFDRPTKLEGGAQGLAKWLEMFGARLPEELRDPDVMQSVERYAARGLMRDGSWWADYRRLRVVARKSTAGPSAS